MGERGTKPSKTRQNFDRLIATGGNFIGTCGYPSTESVRRAHAADRDDLDLSATTLDEKLMIRPPLRSRAAASRRVLKLPLRLTAIMRSNAVSSVCASNLNNRSDYRQDRSLHPPHFELLSPGLKFGLDVLY